MKVVIQKVTEAIVEVEGKVVSEIGKGLMVLVGIEEVDGEEDIEYLSGKIVKLRIFEDEKGVMNLSCEDVGGDIMVVSQFTLQASTKKGNRPSYLKAAKGEISEPIYERFVRKIEGIMGKEVKRGVFGADMKVGLVNDGPTTIIIDSKNRE